MQSRKEEFICSCYYQPVMKKYFLFLFFSLVGIHTFCQEWKQEQLDQADTGGDISYLTEVEKDAIMYINLARLFPKDFVKIEVENYSGPAGDEHSGVVDP